MGEIVAFRTKTHALGRVELSEDDIAAFARRLERRRALASDSLAVNIAKTTVIVSGMVLAPYLIFHAFG